MVRLAFRRQLVLATLALALLAPWAAQARPLGSPPAEPLAGLVAHFTEWITAWFGDVGCSLDPNGRCRDALDVGCSMDPNGRCREMPAHQLDVGCSWDPSGGPCHG